MASPNVGPYTVGSNLTLTCTMPNPPVNTTGIVTYLWQCGGCFANGRTDMTIIQRLTDMDTSMINCSVLIDGIINGTSMPFDLQVTQGIFICVIIIRDRICNKEQGVLCCTVFNSLVAGCCFLLFIWHLTNFNLTGFAHHQG